MTRRKQLAITERQFEVLSLLWEHGPSTVREVREQLLRDQELPYTTVLGLLQVMEKEGLVAHDVENQTHRYRPLLSRRQGTSRLLSDFVQRFFCGAAERLVLGLIDARQISTDDLHKLEARLAAESTKSPRHSDAASKSRKTKRTRRKM
ncbi:MAG: BlaI/MecI/CopY family transcriptional regulator [Planctomycetaceae bacterium]